MEMVADIMAAFPQYTMEDILFKKNYNQVLILFHMARFAKHDVSMPELFRREYGPEGNTLPKMKKSDSFRDTHYHDPVKGWVKKDG